MSDYWKEYRRPDGTTTLLPGGNEHVVEYYERKGLRLVENEVAEEVPVDPEPEPELEPEEQPKGSRGRRKKSG